MTFRLLNVQIVPSVIAGSSTGFSSGSVMCQNCCQRDARSIRAASYSSCGMPCMPPSAITIMNGKPSHTLATMQA